MGIIKKVSSTDQIIEYILGQIRDKTLRPGDQLMNERAFSEVLGVSRIPLREAISALSILGIVEAHQGAGTFVRSYDPSMLAKVMRIYAILDDVSMHDIFELRAIIESQTARIAAEQATPEELMAIEVGLRECEETLRDAPQLYRNTEDGIRLFNKFNHFHCRIAKCAHNKFMEQFMDSIRLLSLDYLILDIQNNPNILEVLRSAFEEHAMVYKQIRAKNGVGAADAMYHHLINECASIQSSLNPVEAQREEVHDVV